MYKFIYSGALVSLLFIGLTSNQAEAATTASNFQFQSQSDQLSYLYGVIAQLQAQLSVLQTYQPATNSYNYQYVYPYTTNTSYTANTSSADINRVVTGNVSSNNRDAITFAGEVSFRQRGDARAWFEYGPNTNLAYSTKSVQINGRGDDLKYFDINATDFDSNRTYYYRAVVEDRNGRYVEGSVKSFRTNVQNNYNYNYDYDYDRNRDWSLQVNSNYYRTGDNVRVDYRVNDSNNKNWVGLYRVGDNDSNYTSFKYIRNDEGYENFRVSRTGDYEFRLFSDDTFNLEARSNRFQVNN